MSVQDILKALRAGELSAQDAKLALDRLRVVPAREEPVAADSPASTALAAQVAALPRSSSAPRDAAASDLMQPIAIVGASGRYPQAPDLESFWDNLLQGRDSIREIPANRWNLEEFADPTPPYFNKIYCRWLGVLDDVAFFDPLFFNISPAEAEQIDPQHRIFLEEAYRAFEDAGYAAQSLGNIKCGVYFGVMSNEYSNLALFSTAGGSITGTSNAIGAARIAYYLNLKGPAIAIDTACSSSLVATHLACAALRNREIDMAICGGASLYLMPQTFIGMCAARMLSPSGRCKTFDNGADGFVPGEGAGVLVLKRLSDAEADHDGIHALIIGSGINQDGKTNGITAPCKSSQIELEREVYARYGIDPETISYVEMHGTGTKLGDPIELDALSTVYKERTAKRNYCALGSVKSNIGHTSAAAGVAGIHKVLLAMRHKMLVPTLHFSAHNEHFDFVNSPFFVNTQARPWRSEFGMPRRAAVSSFGFSGTNAHLVMEQYLDRRPRAAIAPAQPAALFVLSAHTARCLHDAARRLARHLAKHPELDLQDVAFTLQVGRDALEQRLAIVTDDKERLLRALENFADDVADGLLMVGIAKAGDAMVARLQDDDATPALLQQWFEDGQFAQLAGMWVRGLQVDWRVLRRRAVVRRVSLPGYPFEKLECWLPGVLESDERAAAQQASASGASRLHPLLHRNTSDFTSQRFQSTFTGEEFFLAGHRVHGQRVLPGVAYLEMVRAGVDRASGPAGPQGRTIRLCDVTWVRPVVASIDHGAALKAEVEVTLRPAESGDITFEVRDGVNADWLYCQGRAMVQPVQNAPRVDLAALKASVQGGRELSAAEHYGLLEAVGVTYSDACRGIERVTLGADIALARLRLPAGGESGFVLHPTLLDAAFQASIGLALTAIEGDDAASATPALPFALESIDVFDAVDDAAWAAVHRGRSSARVQRFDIDLFDDDGRVLACVRGLSCRQATQSATAAASRPDAEGVLYRYVPQWEPVPASALRTPDAFAAAKPAGQVLVVGGSDAQRDLLREMFPAAVFFDTKASGAPGEPIDVIAAQLRGMGQVGHIIWLATQRPADGNVIAAQEEGALFCFAFIKALLALDYWSRPLAWTVVTQGTQAVRRADRIDAAHASLHGLIGSLAKEYPDWSVRVADVDANCPLQEVLRLPYDKAGNVHAWRDGEWYRQHLFTSIASTSRSPLYKSRGLYVVIGGAGGIGEVWSEWMIRRHQARIVWLGRRERDAAIEAKQRRLGELGETPLYIGADATDAQALRQAYRQIKQHYAGDAIDGVVHSAIVLADKSLANMTSEQFAAGLRVKVDASAHLAEVFGADPLDFIVFFSSVQSFVKEPGQSNYAAGCTFTDAYAHELSQRLSCVVKAINWGYWGNVGIVAGEAMRQRMAGSGIGSIEPAEGMAALDALLAGPWPQLAVMKLAGAPLIEETNAAPSIALYDNALPLDVDNLRTRIDCSLAVHGVPATANADSEGTAQRAQAMEDLLAKLLFVQLHVAGLFAAAEVSVSAEKRRLDTLFGRWFDETLRALAQRGYIDVAGDEVRVLSVPQAQAAWQEWEEAKASADPQLQSHLRLVESMLRSLPEIVTGKRLATDILFGGEAMTNVSGVYQGHSGADYFNTVVAAAVTAYLNESITRARARGQAPQPLRILEIGAGTGATSAAVMARLDPFREFVGEYCYTDISRAFLVHAEETYGADHPYLRYRIFDVERPLCDQDIDVGAYDVVIATNVLHATRDIRRTVRNAKAVLRGDGLLLLNEMHMPSSLFTHLTFGLTKGWWLFEDDALRVPGSPGLLPQTWQRVLEDEGFGPVFFPAEAAHALGQQVVVAKSDGVVRQQRAVPARVTAKRSVPTVVPTRRVETANASVSGEQFRDRVIDHLAPLIGAVLKLPPEQIDSGKSLERYGLDSIVAVQLAAALSRSLPDVGSMIFLEYQSIDALADHLVETRADELRALLGEAKTAEEIPTVAPVTADKSHATGIANATPVPPNTDIAVVGVAGRYPGARTVEEFWELLRSGRDSITEVPPERWDHTAYFDPDKSRFGKTYCRWGGFMEGVDEFDPLFFDITPANADLMDPQVRLCLQTVWELLERAGQTRDSLERQCGSRVGVFIGAMYQQYQMFETEYLAHVGVGLSSYSAITNRVSNFFNFKGPSVAVDTQCSSAMIAVHMACRSLIDEECAAAVAGGVNLLIHPSKYVGLSMALMLGSRPTCRSFTDSDGFLPAEGVGAVFLKPLARAQADGDPVLAVIKYTGQCHGGRGIGYGTQDPNAQLELLQTGLRRSGIDPHTIGYVEAAANGTGMADVIEASSLRRAYRQAASDRWSCAVGTVKSNLGHVEAASGMAQLTKVILQLRHRQIAPLLHLDKLNPNIDFSGTSFHLAAELEEWRRPVLERGGVRREFPRRAAINTFGGGGSLAHAIVEEYAPELYGMPVAVSQPEPEGPHVAVISAKTAERLRAVAVQLLSFVERDATTPLADIVYSLQVRRESMEHRLALLVASREQLLEGLRDYLQHAGNGATGHATQFLFAGNVDDDPHRIRALLSGKAGARLIAELIERRDLEKLALYWSQGGDVPWHKLHARSRPHVVELPTYPFERRRCWLNEIPDTRHADWFAAGRNADAPVGDDEPVDQAVYRTLRSMLGLQAAELQLDESLARYELLSVLLPRIADRLEGLKLRIDPVRLGECKTPRDIAAAAMRVAAEQPGKPAKKTRATKKTPAPQLAAGSKKKSARLRNRSDAV